MRARLRFRRAVGFTLIELMVAIVLGLLVAAGIVRVFLSTSSSSRAQTQMALLQEEGRFAMTQLKSDLRMANGQYCSGSGGNAHPSARGPYLDGLRAPIVYASGSGVLLGALDDVTTRWGAGGYPAEPTATYALPSFLSMRGYDCTAKACTPADPSAVGIPAMGTKTGNRVPGAAVLTLRYLDPASGWAVVPAGGGSGSSFTTNADGSLAITLRPQTAAGEPPISRFAPGDLAMLADCSRAQVYAASGQGSGTITSTSANFAQPAAQQGMAAPKLFDFSRDYLTVTYYLKVVDNGDGYGHTTGALIRRVNGGNSKVHGGSEDELVRGVERLDFKYGVQYADGSTRFYTAQQVDASTSANCPASSPAPAVGGSNDPGCLWRAVTSIEIDLLMDGQVPLYTLTPNELQYTYATDAADGNNVRKAPDQHAITPAQQGFPNELLRREFTALVSVRNFNP